MVSKIVEEKASELPYFVLFYVIMICIAYIKVSIFTAQVKVLAEGQGATVYSVHSNW